MRWNKLAQPTACDAVEAFVSITEETDIFYFLPII